MADCLHESRIKLFIVKRQVFDNIPDHTGYFICSDCSDYLATGWVHEADVWTTSDIYSMNKIIRDEDVGEHDITPIEMFKDWIKSDLAVVRCEEVPQLLAP